MNVSKIFADFDLQQQKTQAEKEQASKERLARRAMVLDLMLKVVKPFSDQVIAECKPRQMNIAVEDRGNDAHRPSFTIQFTSYENQRTIVGAGPSIKLLANEDFHRIEVDEQMGDLDEVSFDSERSGAYPVQMGQPDMVAKMTESLEAWLRKSLELISSRKK